MAAQRTIEHALTLANSVKLPQLGFGVYQSPRDVCVRSCLTALEAGYRHIDTAQYYANEAEVGHAVAQSGIPRKDLFLTTKILSAAGSADATFQKCADSVNKLDQKNGYVDLFLVHSPNSGKTARTEMWQALEKLHGEGKSKSIGVSNYGIKHIEEMKEYAKVWPPHVNQIEVRGYVSADPVGFIANKMQLHPWCQQREIVDYCNKNKIIIEAYCPLVRNAKANDKTLASIAEKHKVTPNQVLCRWSLQKGWSPLPKSENPDRIKLNADLYGFDLDEKDMSALDGLDEGPAGAIVQAVDN
ncbi:hypothetical protein S40293_04998 [Stachybotrys chartarum IBT 40293]|nr:hypothetical protein S40293_04998 [Stachybotrys chartarum IBT 40293]